MNAPDFEPNYFEPMVMNGEYIGKYKNAILFRVPKSEVLNPSLNLTQWINNLRVASGGEPLTLVEAQKQMYQLAITNEEINGIASWYGPYFQGRQTASGEQFEQQDFTAAHKTLPFNTYLKVTNQENGKSVVVRINDRGPYFGDRNLDLSHAAAIALNSDEVGLVPITATILASNN
jgi:rare lipoprotein A